MNTERKTAVIVGLLAFFNVFIICPVTIFTHHDNFVYLISSTIIMGLAAGWLVKTGDDEYYGRTKNPKKTNNLFPGI